MSGVPMLTSTVPDSRDAPSLGWGVIGTGWIAERFVDALLAYTGQRVVAVAARRHERARAFAAERGVPTAHPDVSALLADPSVDVVYIATPHPSHAELAIAAIEAGKHVLIEKPLALDAAEAREVAARAREAGVYCAEALWTFFLPRFDVVRRLIDGGEIGDVRTVLAEYGEYLPDHHRAMDPALAGGSLLDLGTYPIALAARWTGRPVAVHAVGESNRFGVNAQTGALVQDEGGRMAVVHTSLIAGSGTAATILGTQGSIELPGPFYQPGSVLLRTREGRVRAAFDEARIGHAGLHFEVAAVARDIASGRTESAVRPLDDTITFLELMDAIRAEASVDFDAAKEPVR
ncbi:Gfo/Idh/MocA family oxidoreductase [Leifsonia sp. fls2-241-R2A-40a]|uniref:Gfo/Idh/MocA family protein n=1 Tax=Leifsonia sp. fls2-241-R2A-40a TaxID=3040290 RepID=UPI00254AA057|nr:Gfo/Idh/MocA family oxidoreductase [Leifsonia sp. fls2-241-R2A-40a]